MDDTLLRGRFIDRFTARYQKTAALQEIRSQHYSSAERTRAIAGLLTGHTRNELTELVDSIELVPGTKRVIAALKKQGYLTGIITDSYDFAAEHVCRKIGADFTIANHTAFEGGIATGEVIIPAILYHTPESSCQHEICKLNALEHLLRSKGIARTDCIAIGDSENDTCMVKAAGTGIAFQPKHNCLLQAADFVIQETSFDQVLSRA